jgi:large subunit ribosomal protein L35
MRMTKTRNPALQVNTISSPGARGFRKRCQRQAKTSVAGRAERGALAEGQRCILAQDSIGRRCVRSGHRKFPRGCRPGGGRQLPPALCQLSPCQPGPCSLFSTALSMQKTKKSVAKRFKLTATGKLMRRTPGFRHLLAAKSTKQKRRASRDKQVAEGHAKPLKRCLPFGL